MMIPVGESGAFGCVYEFGEAMHKIGFGSMKHFTLRYSERICVCIIFP